MKRYLITLDIYVDDNFEMDYTKNPLELFTIDNIKVCEWVISDTTVRVGL